MQTVTLENMSKAYGGVPALSDVSVTLISGRVHALMGENGAGKSTLIKLIAGVVKADTLRMTKDGTPMPLTGPQEAHDAGFRFIHQELNVVPQVSVAENILLGRPYPRHFGVAVNWASVRRTAQDALDYLGAGHINVNALAGDLPAGDKMLIKIAATLVADGAAEAEVYVLDEPTAALTGAESEMLFTVIERLKAKGAAIFYVSHRMDEVLRICDDITVLRDGKRVSTGAVANTHKDAIIHAMTGRDVKDAYPKRDTEMTDDIVVSLRDVASANLSSLSVDLRGGEILGISGLADAGQTEVLRLFLGAEPVTSGQATLYGKPLPKSPAAAWAEKVAYIPRERRSEALMLDMPIRSNTVLPHLADYGLKASKTREAQRTRDLAQNVRLKYDGPEQPVGQLSGGNQQKVVFARALCGTPRLLLLDEPTRGVDVGAKYDIYLLVRALSAQGCTVILTSSDLPEVLGMCDRILVLQDGRQAHLLEQDNLTAADLLTHCYADVGPNAGPDGGVAAARTEATP